MDGPGERGQGTFPRDRLNPVASKYSEASHRIDGAPDTGSRPEGRPRWPALPENGRDFMGSLFVFVVRTTRLFIRALAELLGSGPSISPPHVLRATPGSGWPGTVVTLDGTGFDATLDGNVVEIGGAPTLVMAATAARLTVLVGENATSGAIRVTARGITTTAPQAFEIRAWPDSRDSGASGPPVFFHGPQAGTPALGKKDMRVLVVFASAVGSPAVNIANETAAEMATFASADRFWREATYGRTSFRFEAGPWVHLPLARNAYVFDDRDVEWARDALLTLTKRHTHIDGQRGYCAHQGGGLAVVDLAGSNWPSEVARLAPGWIAHHVVVRGGTAFVAAGKDGLIVVNVAGSLPVQIAKVTLGGNLRGCDVSGNLLVAAAGDGGVEFYDVSNPAAPVRHTVFATGVEWATAVKLVGTRAYVGAGKGIRVYDVSNFFVPHLTGSAALGDWAMGLDVAGNTCVVATDGGGLAVFDVSGPSPSPRGNNKDALNLFNVHLAGGLAYAAAGADGVLVVDVANPSSPTLVKLWPTGNACYDVAIGPGFGVAALGASGVAPVSLADPRQPLLGIQNYLTSTPPLGGDPNLGTLRTNLKNAANSRGKSKGSALMVHALLEAMRVTPGLDPNAFEGFVVVLQGAPGRGASGLTNGASFEGRSLAFSERKGFVWLASHTGANRTTWGRKAHEMGHWFGMPDIYTEWFEDGTFLAGDAENWDMAGDHDRGPLFSGRQADRMALFNPANVARRVWNPAAGPTNETFDIVAHDAVEDASGRIHLLELKVSAGLSYYVEVRQRPATAIFDANIPVPLAVPGRVLVTRVSEATSPSNTFERPTMLFGVLDPGDSAVDAARLLRIEAAAVLQPNPLVCRVIVHWNEEPPPDPDGKFDLRITPWNEEIWETPDIWINSSRNDNAAGPVYESHEPGDVTRPVLSGDRPWVKHRNTIFARITNSGVQAVSNVYATAYVTTPPGIGDNGSWQTIQSVMVPSIAANSEAIVQFAWTPTADTHTCVSVAVMPQAGEIEPRNNRAQENVASFDSRGGSSHEPVVLEAHVRSPFTEWRRVDLVVRGLPVGWHAVVDKQWVWVDPKGSVPVSAVIWTDLNSPRARRDDIPSEAHARVEGWTDFGEHRYLPIGGILAKVRANKRARIERFEVSATASSRIRVIGLLQPSGSGVPGVVEVTDAAGASRLFPITTDALGVIQTEVPAHPGRYDVQVHTSSTREVAEAESVTREVIVPG
jgi:hypothetical protein